MVLLLCLSGVSLAQAGPQSASYENDFRKNHRHKRFSIFGHRHRHHHKESGKSDVATHRHGLHDHRKH